MSRNFLKCKVFFFFFSTNTIANSWKHARQFSQGLEEWKLLTEPYNLWKCSRKTLIQHGKDHQLFAHQPSSPCLLTLNPRIFFLEVTFHGLCLSPKPQPVGSIPWHLWVWKIAWHGIFVQIKSYFQLWKDIFTNYMKII